MGVVWVFTNVALIAIPLWDVLDKIYQKAPQSPSSQVKNILYLYPKFKMYQNDGKKKTHAEDL